MVPNVGRTEDDMKTVNLQHVEKEYSPKTRNLGLAGSGSKYDVENGQPVYKKKNSNLVSFNVQLSRCFVLLCMFLLFFITVVFVAVERRNYLKTLELTAEIELLKSNLYPNRSLNLDMEDNKVDIVLNQIKNSDETQDSEDKKEAKKDENPKKTEKPEEQKDEKPEEKKDEKPKSEGELKQFWLTEAAELRKNFPEADRGLDPNKKYMLYTLGNDYGTGLLHYSSSLWGMMAEARKLNRVLVWMHMLLPPHHNLGKLERIDPSTIFDRNRIESEYKIELIDEADFWGQRKKSEKNGENLSYKKIEPKAPTADLENDETMILERDFSGRWDVFAFSLKNKYNNGWDEQIWYAPHLLKLADDMVDELNHGDYAGVHVRRGDKAARKDMWPNLERDTRADQLAIKLPKYVEPGRLLYIATDEATPGFFDPLKEIYVVKLQDDFKHLWAEGSDWWKSYLEIVKNKSTPMFDRYQQAMIDYTIMKRGKERVETFPHLTSDKWHP